MRRHLESLVLILFVESSVCFHPSISVDKPQYRFAHQHPYEAGKETVESICRSTSWEERLRREATEALLPVFFPTSVASPTSRNGPTEHSPITAEASLKRLLRKKYQYPQEEFDSDRHQNISVNESRGRLAALILGTSVMRLRHWYIVVSQNGFILHHGAKIPIPYPLDRSLLSLVTYNDPLGVSEDENHEHITEEALLVRAMVDEHARYLSSSGNRTLPILPSNSSRDTELAIQYSLPPFFASSLLLQYGYTQAQKICELMNSPGPITLRRNAIQFPGSDDDLCEWLWEEDGIKAESCNRLHSCQNITVLSSTLTRDGSNGYVVGSSSIPGSILPPPNGAIRILPPESIDATTAERRRSIKSIWSMRGWQNGYFEVQDAGSQIITQSLEVRPGESILDYCAGNGGKSFGLASALLDTTSPTGGSHSNDECGARKDSTSRQSKIVAHDVVDERLRQIKGSLKRVGFTARVDANNDNDTVYVAQNRRGDCECTFQIATSSDLDAGIDCIASCFDAVLVDAPCSSTGVLRRRPAQRWDLTEKQMYEELPKLQLEVLEKAASFVAEGGRLVYSTCSLLTEENDFVARKFEQSTVGSGFERWDFSLIRGNDSLLSEDRHTLTLLPSEISDGFFIARWKRGTKV
ncbi:hypothetical protein ACHAW5_000588 [Stephanodiscus triporus]|uniref:SAM-dependent MTase RsmB/NOP-type domain-containing protein n=1 Tax=Stephanodiscus triporus TaxID=2934178 RepID=A0ABD3QGM7_9STRA